MTQDLYPDPLGPRSARLLATARRVNARRDREEHAVGFAAPPDMGLAQYVRNALMALMSGLETEDWPCIAEGTAMLQDIEWRMRHGEVP